MICGFAAVRVGVCTVVQVRNPWSVFRYRRNQRRLVVQRHVCQLEPPDCRVRGQLLDVGIKARLEMPVNVEFFQPFEADGEEDKVAVGVQNNVRDAHCLGDGKEEATDSMTDELFEVPEDLLRLRPRFPIAHSRLVELLKLRKGIGWGRLVAILPLECGRVKQILNKALVLWDRFQV
mgnify:CR=1 FL=1